MTVLVSIALDEFGRKMPRPQFNDMMLGLLEHIPGFETLPRKRSQQYLRTRSIWLDFDVFRGSVAEAEEFKRAKT